MHETESDEWYALLKKGDDILERKNAYNKGMMGLLDGQKAVTASEQAAQTGGDTRRFILDDDSEQPEQVSEKDEENFDFVNDVLNTVSNFGKWVFDAVTGGAKWVQDNADTIRETQEAVNAEEQRILEMPMSLLTLEELRKRQTIEIMLIEEKLDEWRDYKLEELSEKAPIIFKDSIYKQYKQKFAKAVEELNNVYEPYIEKPADEKYDANLCRRDDLEFFSLIDERLTNGRVVERSPDLEKNIKAIVETAGILEDGSDANIKMCETYGFDVSDKDAYNLYIELLLNEKNVEDTIFGTIIDLIPGASEIYSAYMFSQDQSNVIESDFYDSLGGEYTLTTYIFSNEGYWGHGDIKEHYYLGLVLQRDDIELENEETMTYPYNKTTIFEVEKDLFEYMNYTYPN